MPKLHELQEARARSVAEMRALTDKADAENRDFTPDEDRQFKELKGQVADLDRKIERAKAVAEAERSAPAIIHHGPGDGRFEERARDFSIVKAIRAQLGDDVDAGFEREMSAEVKRRTGRTFEGIAVPDEVFLGERRVMLTSDAAAPLVPNVHRADMFIDRLRNALVTERLGATILDNLVGDVDIPRQTASAQAQWVGEDGEITATDLDFDDVALRPKTVGAITSYSRRTLINSVPSIEQIVRNDLARQVANAIDFAALLGTGTDNTPRGIANTPGVHQVDMSAGATWDDILDFIAGIEGANAWGDAMGWALNPYAVKKLRGTLRVAGDAGAGFLMDGVGQLAGYPAAVTNALPGNPNGTPATVIFGNWSDLLIGYWSGTDILVNPYEGAAYSRGRVLVRAMRDVDVQVRHGESFSISDDMPVGA